MVHEVYDSEQCRKVVNGEGVEIFIVTDNNKRYLHTTGCGSYCLTIPPYKCLEYLKNRDYGGFGDWVTHARTKDGYCAYLRSEKHSKGVGLTIIHELAEAERLEAEERERYREKVREIEESEKNREKLREIEDDEKVPFYMAFYILLIFVTLVVTIYIICPFHVEGLF